MPHTHATSSILDERSSGVLLHISSLPSRFGIGDLGPTAYHVADLLKESGQTFWQILPLNPTSAVFSHSPYSSESAFAGNIWLLSPEQLRADGLIDDEDLQAPDFPDSQVDFPAVIAWKEPLLHKAYDRHLELPEHCERFARFCEDHKAWLDDFSLFVTLKERFGPVAWSDWPAPYRDRDEATLAQWREEAQEAIARTCFHQYLFFRQWNWLKDYCREKGLFLIGDLPIYVSYDSADTWAHPHLFKLDEDKRPLYVAGAPPDYFSETGQRWGNPVYDWARNQEEEYAWWIHRFAHNLTLCDLVRVDHFRGFAAYWEIPEREETAINGTWVDGPGKDLFDTLRAKLPALPIIAEDLGMITPDVHALRRHIGSPGMSILLFAFGPDLPTNLYAPHNVAPDQVIYTGTHDNNTACGWFVHEASEEDRQRIREYVGYPVEEHNIHWALIRLAMCTTARTAIFPLQDLLGLDQTARLNLPATTKGNWTWRATYEQLDRTAFQTLHNLAKLTNRIPSPQDS